MRSLVVKIAVGTRPRSTKPMMVPHRHLVQEGVISDSTHVAESSDEDKPAATSTSRDSQGVAPLSLIPLLVKHGEKIQRSRCRADAR